MTKYGRIPEHEEYLASELNIIERVTGVFTGVDDHLKLIAAILEDIKGLLGGGAPPGGGGRALGIRSVRLLKSYPVLTTNLIDCELMADASSSYRVLVYVNNLLDQGVRIDVIGNIADSVAGSENIYQFICPTLKKRVYGLKLEEWMPYIGVRVQASTAPTAGTIDAYAIIQE